MNDRAAMHSQGAPVCVYCGPETTAALRFEKMGYRIYRCAGCGLLFVYPQPPIEEILAIYDASYFERGDKYVANATRPDLDPNRQNDLHKTDLLSRHAVSGRLLDVGCAMGGFLDVAREKGFEVVGVEVSEAAARHAKESLGLEVANCDLPAAKLPSEHFDVVTLWDVIEHLDDPEATLAEANRILRPEGVLVLSTGDASSLWARIMGRRWQLLTPPQHLYYYDEKCLTRALEAHGFGVVEIHHPGKRATVDFILFKACETFGRVVSPIRSLFKILGLSKVRIYVNLGDMMTCVAKKVETETR